MAKKHVAQIGLQILSRLSLHRLNKIADGLAYVCAHTPNQLSRITRANICLCFGQSSDTEKKQLYRASLRNTCRSFLELAAIWCWPAGDLLAQCEEVEICSSFRESRRGKIIIAPHIGSWETLNLWLAAQGPTMSLYKRRKKQPALNQFMVDARSRNGATLVSTKAGGLRTLLKGLQKGDALMVLPDQKPSRKRVRFKSTFLGFEAWTTTLVHALADRQHCDVFIAAAIRKEQGSGFQIYLDSLDGGKISGELETSVDYMNRSIEEWIRRFPQQYQWAYRRFTNDIYKDNNCL